MDDKSRKGPRTQGRPKRRRSSNKHRRNPAGKGKQPQRARSPRSVDRNQLPGNFIYGINPVAVALEQGLLKTMFYDKSRQSERLQHIHALAQDEKVEIKPLQPQGWSKIIAGELHQGIAGILADQPKQYLEEIVHDIRDDSCILVLDRIQDPQNLGAVLRTAAATNVDAIVLPKAGGCGITSAVHKASAGMSLKVRIIEDENLARAIEFLKDHGFWVIGCDSGDGEDATVFEFPQKRVIVMGNEAEGMRRLVKESCDYLVRIPMAEGVESLNISVATAVVLYLAQADLKRAELEAQPTESKVE